MGLLELCCCIRKSDKTKVNQSVTYKNPQAHERVSTVENTQQQDLIFETQYGSRNDQSKSTGEEIKSATSLHDVTVTAKGESTPSPKLGTMAQSPKLSSGESMGDIKGKANVNVVRPRITGQSKITAPGEIEQLYKKDAYDSQMSRTHTSMSFALNKEPSSVDPEDSLYLYDSRQSTSYSLYGSREHTGYSENDGSYFSRPSSGYSQYHTSEPKARFSGEPCYSQKVDYRLSCNDDPTDSRDTDSGTKVYGLLQAACKGDMATLQRLSQENMDMGVADYDGRRALHLAAAEGHLDCVRFLLEKCNVPHSPRDRWYHTPLDEAKTFKREAVVKYLDDLITKEEEKERGAKTFLLLNSACRGDVRTLRRLYQEGIDMKLSDYDGRTCLHLAASEGHLECLQFLLEQCEIPHSPKDRWFHTPLNEARNANHTKCVEYLEDYIQQYDAKKEGASVYSILNSAAKGDTQSLERLVRSGEDMMASDYDGRTALHLAASEGHMSVVAFLLEKCKVDPNPKDRWQHTPLDEAKNAKHDNIIKYLERHISNKTKIISDSKAK